MTVTINTLGPGIASQTTTVVSPAGTTPVAGPTFGGGSDVPKPAPNIVQPKIVSPTVNDGYSSPLLRDTSGLAGGTPGNVNTTAYVQTTVGKDVRAFEWSSLVKLDNHADAGENVAMYAQANKHGTGPTWGACFEVTDTTPGEATGLIGAEVDVWCSGPDVGARVGVDVAVGDAAFIRHKTKTVAGATYGVRVGSSGASPWATWGIAYSAANFTHSGLHLSSKATRAIQLQGEYVVGLDLSTAKCQSAIRLAPGQRMTFEPTDQISWSWSNGRLRVQNGAVNVLEIDTTTGDIYKLGVKVL